MKSALCKNLVWFQDVGFRNIGRRSPVRKEDKGTFKKSFGSFFSPKKTNSKPLPPKDYDENPPSIQQSVESTRVAVDKTTKQESLKDKSEESCTSDEEIIPISKVLITNRTLP